MKTTTFLTFVGEQCGKAEEAMNFYVSVFPNSHIENIIRYDEGEPGGGPNFIKFAVFFLNGVEYKISESSFNHKWSFSPGVSILVESQSETEIQKIYEQLFADGGQIMVPLDKYEEGDYGFGRKFGWCEDKYGVSWQFILT